MYVATIVTSAREMENDFNIWSLDGNLLYRLLPSSSMPEKEAMHTCSHLDLVFLGAYEVIIAGIDMLAKHYYQSTSVWLVLSVLESDVYTTLHNIFMKCFEVCFDNVHHPKDQNWLQQFDEILDSYSNDGELCYLCNDC